MAKTTKEQGRKPVELYFGTDDYAVDRKAVASLESFCPPENQALGVERLDGRVDSAEAAADVLRRCREAVLTVGFMGGSKLVYLRGADFFGPSFKGKSEAFKKAADRLAEALRSGLPAGVMLLVTAREFDKRLGFYKACKQVGLVEELSLPGKSWQAERQARQTAAEMFRRAGLEIDGGALEAFVAQVGAGDTLLMAQEVEKLAVHLGPGGRVDEKAVERLTTLSAEAMGWALAEAAAAGRLDRSLQLLHLLLSRQEKPFGLLIAIERRFRQLEVLRACLDRGWARLKGSERWKEVEWTGAPAAEEVLAALGSDDPRTLNAYAAVKLVEQASHFTAARLARCRSILLETHEGLFTTSIDPRVAMDVLLVRLTAAAP